MLNVNDNPPQENFPNPQASMVVKDPLNVHVGIPHPQLNVLLRGVGSVVLIPITGIANLVVEILTNVGLKNSTGATPMTVY